MSVPSLLFVCLGNICRSPLAEAAFRRQIEEHKLDFLCDSAGTGAWHIGEAPDRRAQKIALENGIDIRHYKARQVIKQDFEIFDYIFALDQSNLNHLTSMAPKSGKAKVMLLMDLVPSCKGEAVNDPYYGSLEDFGKTWKQVQTASYYFFKNFLY